MKGFSQSVDLLGVLFIIVSIYTALLVDSREVRLHARNQLVSPRSGFSFRIVHRDAPKSQIRHSATDTSDLPADLPMKDFIGFGRALRARHRKPVQNVKGRFSYNSETAGGFYLEAEVGTPPQKVILIVDTASELVWMQCAPCKNCTDTEAPVFRAAKSSSYKRIPCASPLCTQSIAFSGGSCSNDSAKSCLFKSTYGDGSLVAGYLSIDGFTIGSSSRKYVFGCALIDIETVVSRSSGIMGLNAGPYSFASQLLRNGFPKKFGYCLPDRYTGINSSGMILFGNTILPAKLRYTPLAPAFGPQGNLYYYLQLTGISVGNRLLQIPRSAFEVNETGFGGTILDAGTAITYLVAAAYVPFLEALKKATVHLRPFSLNSTGTELCYNISAAATALPDVPAVSFHFLNGARLDLGAESILYAAETDGRSMTTVCAALASASAAGTEMNIIGNYQQQNYWIEYDLENERVGFIGADCVVD